MSKNSLNPLLQKLRSEIDKRNTLVNALLVGIEKRQTVITIVVIVLNIAVWWVLDTYVEHKILNLALTILSLSVSIPSAMHFASSKKIYDEVMLKDIVPSPEIDYSGYWAYKTTFYVIPNDDNPIVVKFRDLLNATFNNVTENGVCRITQSMYEMRIHYAAGKVNEHARVKWESDQIYYSEEQVRWLFKGNVVWTDVQCHLSSEFNGIEEYDVCEHDDEGRPSRMVGNLLGCIQSVEQYILKAKSEFVRITEEEYRQSIQNNS